MKILAISQYYYPEPFRITDICESIVKLGHEVTVITGLPNYPEGVILKEYRHFQRRKELINGVQVKRSLIIGRGKSKIKLFLNYFSFMFSATWKVLFLREKIDVVMVHQLSPVMMAVPAIVYKILHRKKMLLYCLDLWPDSLQAGGVKENSLVYKFFLFLSKRIYKKSDEILITSNMFKEYFRNVIGLMTDNVTYLPQYAEDIFFEQVQSNYKNNDLNFVFAGNIGDMQSIETIILAADELKDNTNIKFHIVGDGSKLEESKRLTSNLNLKNVIFYGRRPLEEMPQFYSMADAMLVTMKKNKSLSYTLPGKVQSYMAAGKPILGAIDGETQFVINEAKCGFVCNAEDYITFAEIIRDFCNYKDKDKERFSINSKNYYKDNFSKEQFLIKLEKKLMQLED